MKLVVKYLWLVVVCFSMLKCETKSNDKKETVKKNFNDKASIKKKMIQFIEKEFTPTFLSDQKVTIKNKDYATIDLNENGFLDGVAFVSFLNNSDNSFKETVILYWENKGDELIYKDIQSFDSYIYPEERISNEEVTWNEHIVFTYEVKPDSFGRLDLSRAKEGSVDVKDGTLSYGVFLKDDTFDETRNGYSIAEHDEYKCVSAESGLIYRDVPNGRVLGKFVYGEELHITGITDMKKTVDDDGEKIKGEWVEVELNTDKAEKVFVFSGYLVERNELSYQIIILNSPTVFESTYEKGVVLPGKHVVYDKELQAISTITLQDITEVTILGKTKNKRPQVNEQEYCRWSNYVSVKYQGKDIILFGNSVLKFSADLSITLDRGEKVLFIQAENYTVESADEMGLTGCDDYSEIFIKSDNNYHHIYNIENQGEEEVEKKIFIHDDGMSERLSKFKVKNDTIQISMKQSFQEGKGSYTLNVFRKDGWKYIETDKKREY